MTHRWKDIGRKIAILTAWIICACGIVACGRNGNSATEEIAGTVYVPKFLPCKLPCNDARLICGSGKEFYVLGDVEEEQKVSGSEDTLSVYKTRTGIFKISTDGGSAAELTQYVPSWSGAVEDGNLSITGMAADDGGNLWITEQISENRFELPEGFDETTDNKWDYLTGTENNYIFRKLDSEGRELERIETGNPADGMKPDTISSVVFGREGCIYLSGNSSLMVLDKDRNRLFSLEDKNLQGGIVPCAGGGVIAASLDSEKKRVWKYVDSRKRKWGEEYALPSNAYTVYPGNGKYLFLYESGDSLYGRRAGEQEGEKIISWNSVDIDRGSVLSFCLLADGRIVVLCRSEDSGFEVIVLEERERASLEEKKILTYATLWLGYQDRMRIIRFNKQNSGYRIEIKDYSEYNMESDPQAGLTKLNADILAGKVPDILDMENLPLRQYARKGLLEDLWPYIEKDGDLGRSALMERVLQAAETDGKLCRIFDSFSINTVVGARKTVGASTSWSLDKLLAALKTMSKDSRIFGKNDTKQDILRRVMTQNLESYIDWASGKCTFNSEGFLSVLKFCDTFPLRSQEKMDEDDYEFNRIVQRRQMLLELNLSDFNYVQLLEGVFRGKVTYVGYPMMSSDTVQGKTGSSFGISAGIAMTSRCSDKDGAWKFMRELLLPQSRGNDNFYSWRFPVNREDFMAIAQRAMEKSWQMDENGNKILDENGQPIEVSKEIWTIGDTEINTYAMRQEQFEQFMELYHSIDTVSGSDAVISQIVDEEVKLFFHGYKTARQTAEIIQNRVSLYVSEQI